MYMASLVTSVKNFPPKHRAKVVALLDTMYGAGLLVFFSLYSEFFVNGHETDEENQNLAGFLLTLLLMTAITYVICILFLRIYPSDDPEHLEVEMEVLSDSSSTENLLEEKERNDANSTQTIATESHPKATTMATEGEPSQWEYIKSGLWQTFLSIKFQCLMWAFVLLASTTGMFVNNLTAVTRSVDKTHYNWSLTSAISLSGIAMRFILSPLSDYLYPKVPRALFLIGGDLLSVISYFILLFFLDQFAGLLAACIMVGVSIASSYTFGTTILSEHFGTAHLGLHFGIIKLFDALCGFGMQTAFGEIYDAQIANETSGVKDCYGTRCAVGQMGLAVGTTTLSVLAAVGFLVKQLWDRKECRSNAPTA
jgi:MFS family permease